MGQREILLTIAKSLNKHRVPYLLTGSFAVSYYGVPRATHDIDFVIEVEKISAVKIIQVIENLGDDYIYDKEQIKHNITQPSEFNLAHKNTSIRIDFWVVIQKEFENKYHRQKVMMIDGTSISLISPEDLLLTKLFWCKQVFSERHFTDCENIWKLQKENFDMEYIKSEVQKMKITALFKEVLTNSSRI